MNLYDKLVNHQEKLSVVGLGYVGLPLAVAFGEFVRVVGFDINSRKIHAYTQGIDVTRELGDDKVRSAKVHFTSDETELRQCKFHIVAVPTPVSSDKTPDLTPVIRASETIGRNLAPGSIIVYESTVYPGVTEDVCVPILEQTSGLKCGCDFKVGYSPERINPGDKINRLETIVKVVSGMDPESLNIIAKTYELIIKAGVHKAESIKVAEAAKVIENSQRDINIAFMNELSLVFNKMGIDTKSVLAAASTKWNFLRFTPGLVGGHCIGVDPYYFIYKAEQLGYHSQIILSGRRINDEMGKYVADNVIKRLIIANKQVRGARVGIMGITFKEDCSDPRNSKVVDIIRELSEYGITTQVVDPVADAEAVLEEYGITLSEIDSLQGVDALVFAVAHKAFQDIPLSTIKRMFSKLPSTQGYAMDEVAAGSQEPTMDVLIDVKGIFDKKEAERSFLYWRL